MKKLLVAGIAAAAFCGAPALAADLPTKAPARAYVAPAPVFTWTGFYVGGNIGGHWGSDKISSSTDPLGWTPAGAAFIDSNSPATLNSDGVIGGVQAGYNWQAGSGVFGIETDANWLGGSSSRTWVSSGVATPAPGDFMHNTSQADFLFTLRPRLGVTMDRALLYVTGGYAYGTVKTSDTFSSFGGTTPASTSSTTGRSGWTVGGGLEYAYGNNWSAKIEYLYVDLGSFNSSIPSCAGCAVGSDITVNHKYTDNIVRVGLNYKFGDPWGKAPVVTKY